MSLKLIYQNKLSNMMDLWFEDFDSSKKLTYFSAFQKKWINKDLKIS